MAALGAMFWPLLTPSPAQQPGKDTGKPAEVQLLPLRYARAVDVLTVVRDLMGNQRDGIVALSADAVSNTVIVSGSAADVVRVKDLIQKLDANSRDADVSGPQVWVVSLRNIQPDQTVIDALKLVFKGSGDFAVDRQRNLVIFSADVRTYQTAVKLLDMLDKPGQQTGKDTDVDVRVVWLASGLAPEATPGPPEDLKELLPALAKVGIERPRLVAQTLVSVTGTAEFRTSGFAKLEAPCRFAVTGRFGDKDLRTLQIGVQVAPVDAPAGKSRGDIKIQTEINAPPGHLVVLGVTPTETVTNVFVIQVVRKSR
jgi:hypothetical protein